MVAVRVQDFRGSKCEFTLYDPVGGRSLDIQTAMRGKDNNTVMLDPGGSKTAYLRTDDCVFRAYAAH